MSVRLAGIGLHPVKSTAIRPVETAYVGPTGLVGDREWMVVDGAGVLVTARELPELFRVVADTPATGGPADVPLRLSATGAGVLDVVEPTDDPLEVTIHGRGPYPARPAGSAPDAWLAEVTGRDDLRLVWCSTPESRVLKESLAGPGDRAAFQDNSPVSLASTTSMGRLNEWTGAEEPLPVGRFRANLVVDGVTEPFAEDGWSTLRVGDARLRVAAPIDRCVMTTIDPATLEKGTDPIRTLATHRRWEGKTWFAVHLMIEQQGRISVGDEVTVA